MPNPAEDEKVYTLADLESWERIRPGLPPSLAVLGHPVAHSVSPQMHNAALAELAKKYPQLKEWRYFKFEILPEELKFSLSRFKQKNFGGLNLTIPHKINATYFVKNRSSAAVQSGAVNTLIPLTDNEWNAENTDGYGLAQSVKYDLGGAIAGREVVVLGTGGAANATVIQCLENHCSFLWLGGRKENEMQLDQSFHRFYNEKNVKYFNLSRLPILESKTGAIVINATSLGLKAEDPAPIDVKFLPLGTLVLDMIYRSEGGTTALVTAARERGLRSADGLGMLVWQGAKSLTIWLKAQEGIEVKPEEIAQTMMTAACQALGLPPRHV